MKIAVDFDGTIVEDAYPEVGNALFCGLAAKVRNSKPL